VPPAWCDSRASCPIAPGDPMATTGRGPVISEAMQAPAITRHRRPFLAPLWLFAAVIVIATGAAVAAMAAYRSATTTTVIVARHAEKMLGTIDDPPLAQAGELRAQQLARMFGD